MGATQGERLATLEEREKNRDQAFKELKDAIVDLTAAVADLKDFKLRVYTWAGVVGLIASSPAWGSFIALLWAGPHRIIQFLQAMK